MPQPAAQPGIQMQSIPQPEMQPASEQVSMQPELSNPPFQSSMQFNQVQPITNGAITPTGPNVNNSINKKNLGLIIGCSVGAFIVVIIIVIVIIMLLGHSGKTVSCTSDESYMGINATVRTEINTKDGGLSSGSVIVDIDLTGMSDSYREYEKDLIDDVAEYYKDSCEEHCTSDYDYIENQSVKYTMRYDEEGINDLIYNYGLEDMTAQEVADYAVDELENSYTTCTQY